LHNTQEHTKEQEYGRRRQQIYEVESQERFCGLVYPSTGSAEKEEND
jgi:hypothetical protein